MGNLKNYIPNAKPTINSAASDLDVNVGGGETIKCSEAIDYIDVNRISIEQLTRL